jgi:leader peptidase (prepilin peptidase)/N-methyltransferase
METPFVIGGLLVGALIGLVADRIASRWPAHPDAAIRPVDWRTAVVVAAGAASFAGLIGRWEDPRDVVVLGIYVAALIVLLATDLDQMLLPDLLTFPLIAYTTILLVTGINPVLAAKDLGLVSGIAAAFVAPALLWVTDKVFRGSLGMGDLKLAVSLGLLAGLSNLFVGFLVATVAFAVVVVVLLGTRRVGLRTAIPFGPALIAAGIIAILLP